MKFYITTAIDYVNGKPHLGHTLEKVQADVVARYQRLLGNDVFFLIGTDEHGFKNTRAAQKARKSPKEFTTAHAVAFQQLWQDFNISFDDFIRTTDQKRHWPTVRKVWKGLDKSGDLYKKEYEGLYCYGHEAFVTKKDLIKGKCEIHGAPPELVREENYFFKLSKYTSRIYKLIKTGKLKIIPKERTNEILKLLEKGLEDVSFSRPRKDLAWGIPVPGDRTHTIYVWADALPNYISALGWGTSHSSLFKKYWPADVHVIGKDILRFHAAIWPGMLLSLGLPLPKQLFVHGFISVDGQKMSKSLGNVINPVEIIRDYGADALRWYLLAEIPSTKDGDFTLEKFEARYNGDLALGIGNFLARIVGLGERHLTSPLLSETHRATRAEIERQWKTYRRAMNSYNFIEAIHAVQKLIAYGDRCINTTRLWELVEKPDKFRKELSNIATVLAEVAWMLAPIIPSSSLEIFKQLGIDPATKKKWSFIMRKGKPLFPRL